MSELNELFQRVMKLRAEVNNINAEINRRKLEFDESIRDLNNDLFLKKVELDAINDYKVSIRLGDLIDELLDLFNLDKDADKINYNVTTSISFYGKKNMDDIIRLNNNSKFGLGYSKNLLYILMEGTKKTARYDYQPKSFMYSIFLPLDLEAIQADDKSLLEHCSLKVSRDFNRKSSSLVVDRNVEDIILDIDMNVLLNTNKPSFYPADAFREAVGRCIEKKDIRAKKRQL